MAGEDEGCVGDVWVCDARGTVLSFDTHYECYGEMQKIRMRDVWTLNLHVIDGRRHEKTTSKVGRFVVSSVT